MLKRLLSGMLAAVLFFGLFVGIAQPANAASALKSSDELIKVVKTMEGFSKKPYWDVNHWAVGYGTACPDDKLEEYKQNGITKAEAEVLLKKELASFENAINKFADEIKRTFTQNEFDALVSFTYNCGTGWMSDDEGYFNKAVRAGDTGSALLYGICLWSSSGGEYILLKRRLCEANMYINGVYKASNSGDKNLYPDNFRWVFLDGNGGGVRYRIAAYDSNNPVALNVEISNFPMSADKYGNAFTCSLEGWYTEDGKKVTTLNSSLERGQILYAKWKDPKGNIVEIPKGQPPETDRVVLTGDMVNVRTGPGTYYPKVSTVSKGTVLTITSVCTSGGHIWGETDIGWLSLTYTNYQKAPIIVRQPTNAVAVNGDTASTSVDVVGTGLTYQWYYKNAGTKEFLLTKTFTGNNYSVTMDSSRTGRQIYCVITDKYGNSVKTNTVNLGMKVSISTQPASNSAANGKPVKVSVSAVGDGLSYQWYVAAAGSNDFSKSSITGSTYETIMDSQRNGRRVYCVITDKYGNKVQSNTATIYMGPRILKQPVSASAAAGKTVKVSVSATGQGLTYRWYYRDKGTSEFYLTTSYSGSTYDVTMNSARAGRQLYCVITDKYGNSVQTNTVTIGMNVSISTQPASNSAANGKPVKVSVSAVGDGLSYQWYVAGAGSNDFSKSSITGSTYETIMDSQRNGRRVYCVITDKYGNKVQSNTATIYMGPRILKQPVSASAAAGKTVKVSVSATGQGLTYRWYYKDKGTSKFYLTTSYSGSTYDVTMNSARAGRQLYCVITDKYGNSVQTNTVTIGMNVSIGTQPVSANAEEGQLVKVSVSAIGDGLSYQWYVASAGTDVFYKSSITETDYETIMDSQRNGRQIYCVVTDQYGNSVKTDIVTINMK